MGKFWVLKALLVILYVCKAVHCDYSRVTSHDLMKCSYGERGSLTATCVNATPNFFKNTLYKFDHLDETLRCVNCTLTTIESNTFDLSGNQIKILDLHDSLIETLKPRAFMGLIFLDELNIADNKIRSIFPGTFTGAKKITKIDLSSNEINILSEDGFAELVNLQNLILRGNKIKVIDPRAFKGLTNLKQLDLSFNFIEAVNSSLENATSLEGVKLNDNLIEYLAGNEFIYLSNLTELDLSVNKLVDGFAINMTPGNKLMKISLARNKINSLWFQTMNLNTLEILDLSFNNISYIDSARFEPMHSLHNLNLAHNKLEKIRTGQFTGLPQLRTLNFSHNVITDVSVTGIFSFQSLHSLDLSHNKILDLDYAALINRIPGLAYLRLEYNELPCDLEVEMQNDFSEDNFKFVLFDNVFGSRKCVDKPVIKTTFTAMRNAYVAQENTSVSASDVWIFVILAIVIAAIGILFYLQFLFYKGVQLNLPRRVASTVQLIPSDNDQDDHFVNV